MLIQIMCFFLGLIALGGLASFAVMVDPRETHSAPYPFAVFFAGISALAMAILGGVVSEHVHSTVGGVITMLMAPTVGLLGGGLFGYRLGLRRRRRATANIEPRSACRNAEATQREK